MSCVSSRTGRAKCSTSWSISSPTSLFRPMPSPRAACCCRWRRRCWGRALRYPARSISADRRMKAADNHFRGFPGLWNIAAFYLFLLHWPPALSSLGVAVLIVLTFAPFHVVHPVRVERLRWLTSVADRRLGGAGDGTRWPMISMSAFPVTAGFARSPPMSWEAMRRSGWCDRSRHDRVAGPARRHGRHC
jgi:hypothetical protein